MRAGFLVLLVALMALAQSAAGLGLPWRTEIVSGEGNTITAAPSIAVRADGTVFLAWEEKRWIYFSELQATTWMTRIVHDGGALPKLVLSPSGEPHITFITGSRELVDPNGDFAHVYRTGSTWHAETIHHANQLDGFGARGAFDSQGRLHAVYSGLGGPLGERLWHAVRTPAGWVEELIPGAAPRNDGFSIAIDDADRVHVLFYEPRISGCDPLKHAMLSGGTWSISQIACGVSPSLAYRGGGLQAIYKDKADNVWHATWDGLAWTHVIALLEIDTDLLTDVMALDSNLRPHFMLREFPSLPESPLTGHPVYATKGADGKWTTTTISYDGAASDAHIAVDHTDTPRVVYRMVFDQLVRARVGEIHYAEPLAAVPSRLL